MSWDVSGSGLGKFSDGFGMVLKTCPSQFDGVRFFLLNFKFTFGTKLVEGLRIQKQVY